MKTILIMAIAVGSFIIVNAQSQLDTSRLVKDTVRSAWSQRPDTTPGYRQQPISSQPFSNPPTPAPLTDPINNPNSGQTNKPEYNEPVQLPVAKPRGDTNRKKAKPITPVTPRTKSSNYDTLPGTKRNG